MQAADREIGRQTAVRARAVAEFAASRPASVDRPQGSPGAMSAERWAGRADVLRPVSEWATQELVVALSVSSGAAEVLLERSLTLVHRLPGTLTALEDGVLHAGHLGPLLDHVAPIADDALRAAVERDLLTWAAGRVTTPAQLRDKARREVLKRAARSAADDLARAVRQRGVSVRPDRVEGMSVVSALFTTPEAAALMAALGAYADALPEDGRTRGQKMADCLLDLVLRPTESALPPVQVTLDVVAPIGALLGGDQPCEIDGQVVPAEMVRTLLAALTGHPLVTTTDTAQHDTTPADSTPADSTPADGTPADPAPADTTPAGTATAAGPALSEDEDFALWAEQLEDRILAGDFDAEPPPDAPDEDHPPPVIDSPAAPDPTVPDGWWARADAAVDDASAAVLTAQQALGHAPRLVATARRADTTDETTWATGPAGRVTAAPDTLTQLHAATGRARDTLAGLLGATAGGGLADRPRLLLTDALTGALLALTDLPALHRADRAGTGLTPPGPSGGYRPGAALDRHVRARDRRCRFPGCRRPVPKQGELDHTTPWPTGQTDAANLTGYCTGHHRGKHQAPGWRHHMTPDGTLTVTTPTGLTAATTPPPY
ncbi:protein of unknown function [Geodermatophilus obscurus]|uniref:DUF222 domain-containing protein n=1 Tax=Geodermatophilus obscurus TaxID=1861 RepID=A0A1I5GPK6_9ACTN|nr:protein of unknown function [Geodermatophilus obscurus]